MAENVKHDKDCRGVFDWQVARRLMNAARLPLVDFKLNRNYKQDSDQCKFVWYFEDTPEFRECYEREIKMAKERRTKKAEDIARDAGIELA